ncbi:purine-cytosine permease family protein [Scopulibacillus cellulosilyticus]|uniref:Purine-cytosine permease family protein n=1 Tax=Scopulibacillus cellulosilyticus TaxID=2665665 RepID=A0ABW2PY30_9BACL
MKVERHFIEFVPEEERHGSVRSLFPMWFAANMSLFTVVTGGLGVEAGLNLFWSAVAILIGNLVGGIFMALHSVQGPRLGIPQMIQSRAQFGVIGAVLPLLLVIIMYVGYGATNTVIAAQALSSISHISVSWGVIIISAVTFLVAIYGHDLIHRVQKVLSVIMGLLFIYVTIVAFRFGFPLDNWSPGQFKLTPFLLLLGVCATWQLTYAPYIADYSRYLPRNTDSKKAFIYTYGGSVLSTVWLMILGAILTETIPRFLDNASHGVASLGGFTWSMILYSCIIINTMGGNVLNIYGGFMSITTVLDTFVKIKSTIQSRFVLLLVTSIMVASLGVFGHENFVNNVQNLILILSYTLFPWTTINLVDFFSLRHGEYNINALFDYNGMYGKFNWKALISYLITVVCEIPFLNTTIYIGPIAKLLNGIDLAWVLAITIPGILYYYLMRKEIKLVEERQSTIL